HAGSWLPAPRATGRRPPARKSRVAAAGASREGVLGETLKTITLLRAPVVVRPRAAGAPPGPYVPEARPRVQPVARVDLEWLETPQILFDVAAIEGRAAEDDRRFQAPLVQRDEVFLHDDRRFHQ